MHSVPVLSFRRCLVLPAAFLLCQCSSISLGPSVAVEGELASPETSLPHYEYPFDEAGRYREDWVSPPSKKRSASRTRNSTSSVTEPPRKPVVSPVSVPSRTATTAAPPKIVSADAPGPSGAYKVRSGDTLWSISRRHGVSVPDLKAANGMRGDTIHVGDLLRLP